MEGNVLSAISKAKPGRSRPVSEQVPFSSEYKWSAQRYSDDGSNSVYVLGAPEVLSASMTRRDAITQEVNIWTAQARRVLLFASSPDPTSLSWGNNPPRLPDLLEPLGLLVFQEELRVDATQTLDHFADLGITIKIISGDHPETVGMLAKKVGLKPERVLVGEDLDDLDAAQFEEAAEEVTVFGRITPKQKERLIETYRQRGYYTAMVGDGVNDILPLKRAHLGIAMQSGAPATRSIADIVLLKDRFSVLPVALQEGQRIIRGMMDVIRLLLTRTFYVFLLIIGVQIAGAPFPVTPKHNALIALLTVGIPILAIAAWAKAGYQQGGVLRSTLRFVFPAAVTISLVVASVYLVYFIVTNDAGLARTVLTGTSILCGLLLLPFVEPPNSWWVAGDELSGDPRPSMLAIAMLGLFILVTRVPALRNFFELVELSWWDYLIIIAVAILWALIQRLIWREHVFEHLLGIEVK